MSNLHTAGPRISLKAGFTLLELLVVMALVGILSAIAIPNYQKFSARARQVEAKIALGAAYMSEISFRVEQNSFTECLRQTGFSGPIGGRNFYSVAFMAGPTLTCGPDGAGDCGAYSWNPNIICDCSCGTFDSGGNDAGYPAAAKVSKIALLINTCANQTATGVPNAWAVHRDQFIVGAAGNISNSNVYDQWQIDEKKNLINIQSGL